jgi:hypothetical protein
MVERLAWKKHSSLLSCGVFGDEKSSKNCLQVGNVEFGQTLAPLNFSTKSLTLGGDRYAIKAIRLGYLDDLETRPEGSYNGSDNNSNTGSGMNSSENNQVSML